MTEKKKNGSGGKTRREFLKDAGLLVGGTAIGSTVLLAACGGGEETTKTVTQTQTATVTTTAGATTVTETQTESRFVCPIDGMEFDTLVELQAHFEAAHPGEQAMPGYITLNVNGKNHVVKVEPYWSLAFVLREKLGLTATKVACDRGTCGHCTVLADGMAVLSCMMLVGDAVGKAIETCESLSPDLMNLHPIAQSFLDENAFQCGWCTPGFLMSTKALLNEIPNPTLPQVQEALSGNLCVCSCIKQVCEAVVKIGGG